jgi:hypothetical protein
MVPINQHETNVEMIGSNNTTKLLFTALFTAVKSFGAPVTGQGVYKKWIALKLTFLAVLIKMRTLVSNTNARLFLLGGNFIKRLRL